MPMTVIKLTGSFDISQVFENVGASKFPKSAERGVSDGLEDSQDHLAYQDQAEALI